MLLIKLSWGNKNNTIGNDNTFNQNVKHILQDNNSVIKQGLYSNKKSGYVINTLYFSLYSYSFGILNKFFVCVILANVSTIDEQFHNNNINVKKQINDKS